SIQQIVFDVYGAPEMMAIVFALIAIPMAVTSYVNSRIVRRFGAKRILLLALCGFLTMAVIHLAWSALMDEGLWSFVALQCLTMACFGLIGANLGALAMDELGHIAGTASSIQGMLTTVGGAVLGLIIGQAFDGTVTPFVLGLLVCGSLSLLFALWANRGRAVEEPVA
ncbi:MAG TPA: MFS transporter, partial [Sphingomonadales bacterium]